MKRYQDPRVQQMRIRGVPAMRAVRQLKRAEAVARNEASPHENRRAHRDGRCACADAPACPWPYKVAYASPQEAAWAQGKHAKRRRWRQGLNVYRCESGSHFHVGRTFSRISAWMRAA